MNFQDFLQLRLFGNNMLAYLACLGILLFGYIFKTLLSRLLSGLAFRFLRNRAEDVTQEQFQELLITPVAVVVFLATIYLAFNVFDYPVHSAELGKDESWLKVAAIRIYQIGFIISVSWIILRLIDFAELVFTRRAAHTPSRLNDQLVPFAKDLLKVLILCFTFLVVLGKVFGVNVAALIGGLGIGGLAVAFAAKESLENLIASFTIFLDRPFAVGDLVEVGNVTGTIAKVGFRSTRLRTAEKSCVTVPNKAMIDKPLDNLSLRTARRVSFTLALSHATTSEQLRHIIADGQQVVQEHSLVTEEVQIKFAALTPAAKEVTVQYFVDTTSYDEYLNVKEELNYRLVEVVEHYGGTFASTGTTFLRLTDGPLSALQAAPKKSLV